MLRSPLFKIGTSTTLALLVAALLAGWGCTHCARPGVTAPHRASEALDADLFTAVVNGVRAGGAYYQVMGQELTARGYPTRPVFTWRLPTLTWIQAHLPSLRVSVWILTGIGLVNLILWFRVLNPGWLVLSAISLPLFMMTLPVWAWVNPRLTTLHDVWIGQLIAISLACWAGGLRKTSVLVAAAALTLRELALPFVIVMAGAAWLERRRRESRAWLAVAAAFIALLAWHADRVRANLPSVGYSNSWTAIGGWCFDLATARTNAVLLLSSPVMLALAVPLMLAALWTWRSPGGRRVAATVTFYLLLFAFIGQPFNWYWGLIIAPLLPLGLLHWIRNLPGGRRSSEVASPQNVFSL